MKKSIFALLLVMSLIPSVSAYEAENITELEEIEVSVGDFLPETTPEKVKKSPEKKSMLTAKAKTLEDVILEGWLNLSEKINVFAFNIRPEDTDQLYYNLVYEHPDLYYLITGYGKSKKNNTDGNEVVNNIYPMYKTTDKEEIEQMKAEIEKEKQYALSLVNDNMTDFEKAVTIHDYIVQNFAYSETGYENYDVSVLATKRGVCQAYALTYKMLMDELGIECKYVSSDAMGHAWNIVKLDGKWYHVDTTYDDPIPEGFAQNNLDFSFLSSEAIGDKGEQSHYGYNLNGIVADSKLYENAPWRGSVSAVVTSMGKQYYVSGNKLVTSDGKTIDSQLDNVRTGHWRLSEKWTTEKYIFAGIAEYNGRIYYNNNNSIIEYNPKTNKKKTIASGKYYTGLKIYKNTLYYSVPEIYTVGDGTTAVEFIYGGEIKLGDAKIGDVSFLDNGNAVIKAYLDEGAEVYAFSDTGSSIVPAGAVQEGAVTFTLPTGSNTSIFVWDKNMKPYRYKTVK